MTNREHVKGAADKAKGTIKQASPLANSGRAKRDGGTATANLLRTTLQACVSGH
jgi:hypothetical protein